MALDSVEGRTAMHRSAVAFALVNLSVLATTSVALADHDLIDCACVPEYYVGERVVLLVDNANGSNLTAGSIGTVLCGTSAPGLYISWDDWSDGHDLNSWCGCQDGDDANDDSHWIVGCDNIEKYISGSPYTVDDNGPADFHTIGEAISYASNGDEIIVYDGTYYESGLNTNGKAITITGAVDADGIPTTIVDAQYLDSVFYFMTYETNSTVLRNLHFRNGTYIDDGGGVYIWNAEPYFDNCTFLGNTTSSNGGAVYMNNAYGVQFVDCTFIGNIASEYGAAISAEGDTWLGLIDCYFSGNNAGSGGGAIYLSECTYSTAVEGCTIIGNGAGAGAGLYAYGSPVDLRDTEFVDNDSGSIGGGAYIIYGNAYITGCRFDDNHSTMSGGGLYFYGNYYMEVVDTTFENNYAEDSGGGMFCGYWTSAVVTNCTFTNNAALYDGGGVYFDDNVNATLHGCTFTGGYAASGSGIYALDGGSITATSCTISSNDAIDYGGGVVISDVNSAEFNSCEFYGNTAIDVGGMYVYSTDTELTDCIFSGNLASGIAGGFYGSSGTSLMTGCTFRGNSAISADFTECKGGAMYNYFHDPTMIACTIEDNTSGTGGGIYSYWSDPVLDGCTVSSNVGKVCGGGMFAEDGVAWLASTTFCANQPDNIIGAWVDQGGNVLSATCEPPPGLCVGDVNADYDVDVLDLLYVIAVWNTDNPAGDINEDGWVDVMDLLEVIGNWGECGDAD